MSTLIIYLRKEQKIGNRAAMFANYFPNTARVAQWKIHL